MTTEQDAPRREGAVTRRALALGAVGALAIGLGGPWVDHVIRGSYMTLDFSTPGAIFLMFALALGVQLPLGRLKPEWRLTPAEMITVYSMMIVASAICTQGLTAYLVPFPSAAYYYASPENQWAKVLLEQMPPWVAPTGADVDAPVIRGLFEGLPSGAAVPWGAWLRPLLCWGGFVAALFALMIAAMVVLRRQWVDHERLSFPLTQLPLELAGAQADGKPVVLTNGLFWFGLSVPVVLGVLKGLNAYFPAVPTLSQSAIIDMFHGKLPLQIQLSWALLGFFYMVTGEATFSLWVLNRAYFVVQGIMNVLGVQGSEIMGAAGGAKEPYFIHFGTGAFLALAVSSVWVGRAHLRKVWQSAISPSSDGDNAGEILSFRAAVALLAGGVAFMLWWLVKSGAPLAAAGLLIVMAFVFYVGITRVVTDFGFAAATSPKQAPNMVISWLGSKALGPAGVVASGLTFVWCSDNRNFVMCSVANSLKTAGVVESRRGRLVWAYVIAIAVAALSSVWLTLLRAYRQGGVTMNDWYFNSGPNFNYSYLVQKINDPTGPAWYGLGLAAAGAALYVAFASLRFQIPAWPLHPVGLAVGGVWMMDTMWFTCFAAWAVKGIILRYGGNRQYRRLRPIFLGLICGQFAINAVWLIIDQITGKTGNVVFWI